MIETPLRFLRRTRVGGAIEYAAQFLDGLLRPELLRSGATPEEERRPLPGDELVSQPMWEATRAVTIHAPVAEVWPWVAQLGYGRGGWYGWNPLEREDTGVARILPGFQSPKVGDILLDGPGCDQTTGAWRVIAVEPPHTLVLHTIRDPLTGRELDSATTPRRYIDCGWAFFLDRAGPGATRLVARTRVSFGPRWMALPGTILPLKVIGGGDTVMQRRLLEGIKVRAEAAAGAPRPGGGRGLDVVKGSPLPCAQFAADGAQAAQPAAPRPMAWRHRSASGRGVTILTSAMASSCSSQPARMLPGCPPADTFRQSTAPIGRLSNRSRMRPGALSDLRP